MKNELVSIIMPIKDNLRFIDKSISSVINQTYNNFELIVIDDSVTNLNCSDLLIDNRIRYYKGNNLGISNALNFGISKAMGNIIARMDCDDIMFPNRIEKQIGFLENNVLNAHIIGSNAIYIKENGNFLYEKKFPEYHSDIEFYMPILTSMIHPTIMTYKNILVDIGGYNELFLFAEDLELYLRLLNKGYIFYNIQIPLLYYRFKKKINLITDENYYLSYDLGKEYLCLKREKDKNSGLRFGLLEYYKGNMKKARKYFYTYSKSNTNFFNQYFRYLLFSFIPSPLVNFFRKLYIPQYINQIFLKLFKVEMQFKKRVEI